MEYKTIWTLYGLDPLQ